MTFMIVLVMFLSIKNFKPLTFKVIHLLLITSQRGDFKHNLMWSRKYEIFKRVDFDILVISKMLKL